MNEKQVKLDIVSRFNRYMVECELRNAPELPEREMVLIDTWWNVNACPILGSPALKWF